MTIGRRLLATCLAALLLGCGNGASTPAPSTAATLETEPARLVLHRAPADLGCDALGIPFHRVTFRIDPSATEQVVGVTDTGATLLTYWADGFVGGIGDHPEIFDASGAIVASDGTVLVIPLGAWPRLHGYFVCPGLDALYVLLEDPG